MTGLSVADYGYLMENGRIVLNSPTGKLKDNEEIKEFYLGFRKAGKKISYCDIKHYEPRRVWIG